MKASQDYRDRQGTPLMLGGKSKIVEKGAQRMSVKREIFLRRNQEGSSRCTVF